MEVLLITVGLVFFFLVLGLPIYVAFLNSRVTQLAEEVKYLRKVLDHRVTEIEVYLQAVAAASQPKGSQQSAETSVHSDVQEAEEKTETQPLNLDPQAVEQSEPISLAELASTRPSEMTQTYDETTGTDYPPMEAAPSAQPQFDIIQKVTAYFTTGNTLVKVGVVLILFGVAFLLKYAVDHDLLPIEVRLVAAALGGLGLLGFGWKFRDRSREYGLVLQGGGIGVLILTTFVSLRPYGLLSTPVTFALLVVYSALASFLAIQQRSQNLAAFGFFGGFLAPVLVNGGIGDNHILEFSYYAVLNLAIVAISWRESWRELNLLGFVFTFAIGSGWGVLKYKPEFFATTQPFLILFFLLYVAIPLLFANKRQPELRGYVDGTIVFGNSLLTLLLQLQLVKGIPFAAAFSAIALAAFYIGLSWHLARHRNPNYRLLAEAFVAIGVVFVTLAIPLAFDGVKTSAIWALEASGLYWVALKRDRLGARLFATFLIFASSFAFLLGPTWGKSNIVFLNTFFFSCLMMAAGFTIVSFLSERAKPKLTQPEYEFVPWATFLAGLVWWTLGGLYEIDRFTFTWWLGNVNPVETPIPPLYELHAKLLYIAVGTGLFFLVARVLEWARARSLAQLLYLPLLLFLLRDIFRHDSPLEGGGWLAWPLALAITLWILRSNDSKLDVKNAWYLRAAHAAFTWLVVCVLGREISVRINSVLTPSPSFLASAADTWGSAAGAAIAVTSIWLISAPPRWLRWPIQEHRRTYITLGLTPIVAWLWSWLVWTNGFSEGSPDPLPFTTIVNPLELTHALSLIAILYWLTRSEAVESTWQRYGLIAWRATAFLLLNGALCRSLHHFTGVPFNFESLYRSVVVQVSISLFWTLLGIAAMIIATRSQARRLWLTGSILLGVVVAKMFLVDMSKTQTIARVVSFIGVGLLFLIVGYVSPIPPKSSEVQKP